MRLTEKEIDIVGHSLGINVYHAVRSKKKKDKKLPSDYYRNRFCTSPGCDNHNIITSLVEKGFMVQGVNHIGPDKYFYVTDEGKEAFKQSFIELITPKQQ